MRGGSGVALVFALGLSAAAVCSTAAQAPVVGPDTRFDAVSITASIGPRRLQETAGRFVRLDTTVEQLIQFAYDLRRYHVAGGPTWVRRDRFDLTATVPAGASDAEVRVLVQRLLADRFRLTTHRERHSVVAIALRRTAQNAELGPRLRRSTFDCPALFARGGTVDQSPLRADRTRLCATGVRPSAIGRTLVMGGAPMSELRSWFESVLQMPVADETGLTGTFDVSLVYVHQERAGSLDSELVSLFTATQEQLGLKLEPIRVQAETLVIDTIERPTLN